MKTKDFLRSWLSEQPDPIVVGQVATTRPTAGFHVIQHRLNLSDPSARVIHSLAEMREIVKASVLGAYRPLKAAPNLTSGWRTKELDFIEWVEFMNAIYPAALSNWVYSSKGILEVTEFEATAARQSGMYHVLKKISPDQLASLTTEVCDRLCLKKRLWQPRSSHPELEPNEIPILCPEACSCFMGEARKMLVGSE